MPLSHAPGQAQCDFGEAVAVISGVECKVHYFVMDLPHSDGCFVKADPAVSRVNHICRFSVNQFCRFTSSAWPRCWAASVR